MSTYWGYHCATCDVSSAQIFNHGNDMLEALIGLYPLIRALREMAQSTDADGWLEVGLMGDTDEIFDFYLEHMPHGRLIVINEQFAYLRSLD